MKTQKLATILAALILLSAASAQEGEQEQKEKVSNTLTASCLVKVTCDPAILPLTFETMDYLMHSSGVAGRAAAEVLGPPRDEPYEFDALFSIEPLSVMPATPEFDARPKPAATPPTRGGRRATPRRPGEEPEGFDEGALEELRYFGERAKYQTRTYSQEEEKERPRARGRRRAPRTQAPGKIVRGLTPTSAAAPPSIAEQTLLFRLRVELPEEIKPVAEEFMKALINNLGETLMAAYRAYGQKLELEHSDAEPQRDLARDRLSEALGLTSDTDADLATRKQLDEIVDLSAWNTEMSFGEAIELLQDSVGPPLKLIVLWRDLQEHTANIDQTTPINMDPISAIPSGKALELLLKSVSIGDAQLGYEIDRGVITIATADRLASAERRLSQITYTDTPVETLLERRNGLFRDKQKLELEIARYEAHLPALEGQIARINEQVTKRLAADPVTVELQKIAELHLDRVEYFKKLADNGDRKAGADLERTIENLARARIELAKRREELSNAAGGNRLRDLNVNLTDLMIDIAVSGAALEVVSRQLVEAEEQLKKASAVDPEISQIRLAQEELEIAERRASELRIRRANLREPTVTVLGGI